MKNIKKLFALSLIFAFTVFLSSCSSNRGYSKGRRSKGKRGCNCPSFSADAEQMNITWEKAKLINNA
jgi:hypothetical protein